jgi:hypothetical protein
MTGKRQLNVITWKLCSKEARQIKHEFQRRNLILPLNCSVLRDITLQVDSCSVVKKFQTSMENRITLLCPTCSQHR